MSRVSRAVSGVKISHSPKSWSETSTVKSSSVSPPKSHGAARRLGFKDFSSVKTLPSSAICLQYAREFTTRRSAPHSRLRGALSVILSRPSILQSFQESMADFFYNDAGRLRSVWRLAIFGAAFLAVATALFMLTELMGALLLPQGAYRFIYKGSPWFVIQSLLLFVPAALIGWGCALMLEDLPWRSLGWGLHHGWMRDALFGTFVGGVAICVAALVGVAAGSYKFSVADVMGEVAKTLVVSFVIFLAGAAAEEMLFRGYPFQTLLRSWPLWVALLLASAPFALVHLLNPNVAPGFTFVNTALARGWLRRRWGAHPALPPPPAL